MVLPQGQAGGVNGAEGIFVFARQCLRRAGETIFLFLFYPNI
jgi:hypothetical protein